PPAPPAPPSTEAGTATLAADRFDAVAPGSITARDGLTILSMVADAEPDALQLIDSPVIHADFPFMALAARWVDTSPATPPDDADAAPPDASATDGDVLVRVSDDGVTWSEWLPMLADDDGKVRSDDHWTRLTVARGRYAQLRMLFRDGAEERAFDQIDLHYFNADAGPLAPMVAAASSQADLSATADVDVSAASIEDGVIKRAAWGADEQLRFKDGAQIWPPEYTIPKALIIHHTVTQNDPVDPAAVMRAIYYFHAVTRGWGDIGYNFLIDHRGNVYEGRFGGERDGKISQGGHALQFNTNSIGIALLGTFTDVRPPALSESALVSFCAAKAFRYHVDPQAGVTLLGTRFAHGLMGHRDALPGHTACPGDAAYARLDAVRIGVAALLRELGGQPTTPPTATPTARPSATATRRSTVTATPAPPPTGVPTPPAGCADAIVDGGFEDAGDAWVFNRSVRTRFDVLAGVQAAFVGLRNDDPDNGTTYASIVQTVTLPPRIDRATLRFAFRSSGDDGDRRLVRLMDGQGRVVALGDVSLPATTSAWTVRGFDIGAAIAPLAGQALRVYFGVVNNGDGRRSFVRFDEVRLEVCPGPSGQTVDPTGTATVDTIATPTPTPTTPSPSATPTMGTTTAVPPTAATPPTATIAPPGPSATRTPDGGTSTAVPTACTSLLRDGGFEPLTAGAAITATTATTATSPTTGTRSAVQAVIGGDDLGTWLRGGDLPATVSRGEAHGGVAALRLGADLAAPDRFGFASAAQEVDVPPGIGTARLSLWVRPERLVDGDSFVVEVRRAQDGVRQALSLPAAGLPTGRWTELSYRLDPTTIGSPVQVYLALLDRQLAEMPRTSAVWVDDVRLDVCRGSAKALSVPFLSVDRP
ncbi:MAG: N-acetylmuramoyl-L-alanine amidase, partial [Ardenticatenales bacterium]